MVKQAQEAVESSLKPTPAEAPGWFGRYLSRISAAVLKAVKAHDNESWRSGAKAGWDHGFGMGHAKGYLDGHAAGIEAGKNIIEIRPGKIPEAVAPGVDNTLFEDWRFPITDELAQQIRNDIAESLPGQEPTPDQWEMILSTEPSTYIVAGAGSGKSTTMVLRLLVLHHYLKISLGCITVVTFTRESRFDFIKKLIDVFAKWGHTLTEDQGRDVVRTFHSRILSFVRCLPGYSKAQAFEFLSDGNGNMPKSMFDMRLNGFQLDMMNACYQAIYERDQRFRDLISVLFRHSKLLASLEANNPDVERRAKLVGKCSEQDEELCAAVEALWSKADQWPLEGIKPGRFPLNINGYEFYANGYIEELDAYVVLGIDRGESKDLMLNPDSKMALRGAVTMKRTLLQAFYSKGVVLFESYAEATSTMEILSDLVSRCPKFEYKVQGEIKPAYIMEAFHAAASFLENLGLEVTEAIGQMSFTPGDPDAKFFEALSIYWPAFETYLGEQSPPILTFNRMFAMFGERGQGNLKAVPNDVLRPMVATLVDEFQDCGANTISWLRAVLFEIKRRGPQVAGRATVQHTSLMAVGDDWQSIYGWRGSSPKFFQDFEEYFPSPASKRILMQENYRSHQMVIDAAESLVRTTTSLQGKHGVAANRNVMGLREPVQIWDRDDDYLAKLVESHYDQGHSILILYRVGKTKDVVQGYIQDTLRRAREDKRDKSIKLLTYHGSKGLQADAVFLVGDCELMSLSPYKNMAYKLAHLGAENDPRPFDTAQGEEVLRLAYVAVTRASMHCYWFVDPPKSQSLGLSRASVLVEGGKEYFDDHRA